jgi:hypothetical protein
MAMVQIGKVLRKYSKGCCKTGSEHRNSKKGLNISQKKARMKEARMMMMGPSGILMKELRMMTKVPSRNPKMSPRKFLMLIRK